MSEPWVLIGGHYLNVKCIIRVGKNVAGSHTIYLLDGHEVSIAEDELSAFIDYCRIPVAILDPKVKRDG